MESDPSPPLHTLTVAEARRADANRSPIVTGVPALVVSVQNIMIPGSGGEVPIRVYCSNTAGTCPVLMHFHGGCWVFGGLDTHDVICRALENRGACTEVSVDYRLASEHPDPGVLDDCWAATEWGASNPPPLRNESGALGVAGDSDGGNLAAAVALCARERKG